MDHSTTAVQSPPSKLALVRELTHRGEGVLATIEAIRMLPDAVGTERAALLVELAALRQLARDWVGATRLVEAAIALEPDNQLVREGLVELHATAPRTTAVCVDADRPTGAMALNDWVVEALAAAEHAVGFKGRDVVEIGGCIPAEIANGLGVKSWTACDLNPDATDAGAYRTLACDARNLPLPDESCDLAFSVCAFEHFLGVDKVLAEAHRVLRPGGSLFTQFAPIWSSANGHHTWVRDEGRTVLTFNDNFLPPWAHLLLSEREVFAFVELTRGPALARRVVDSIWKSTYINRVGEGEFRRFVAASGFDVETYECWGGSVRLGRELERDLRGHQPGIGDPAANGLRWVLRK